MFAEAISLHNEMGEGEEWSELGGKGRRHMNEWSEFIRVCESI